MSKLSSLGEILPLRRYCLPKSFLAWGTPGELFQYASFFCPPENTETQFLEWDVEICIINILLS